MPKEMKGRRVPIKEGEDAYNLLRNAGDYCGPVMCPVMRPDGGGKEVPTLWYLLPIARDPDASGPARSIHCLQSPPHRIIEEPDGSLTVRESIGAGAGGPYYWHGFLTEGRWELNKSKP
jgi:hypothetical protein